MFQPVGLPSSRRLIVLALAGLAGCSGPQPLNVAIAPTDRQTYSEALAAHPDSPRNAYFAWESSRTGTPIADLRAADAQVSEEDNPLSARKDPAAVSRGAVIYEAHCVRCHGVAGDGRGPDMNQPLPNMDFHRFMNRFAVTVHRGAPSTWYRKIRDGYTSAVVNGDGSANVMPPFGPSMAREQIWLSITYLQSLDADASKQAEAAQ